jgi:hypothetical protein
MWLASALLVPGQDVDAPMAFRVAEILLDQHFASRPVRCRASPRAS